jgi:quinol monooxygenase YgiN
MTTPLLLISAPLPPVPKADLIPDCRRLLHADRDWIFLTSATEFAALQLNAHNTPPSVTHTLVHETLLPDLPTLTITMFEPTIGFVQRPDQTIPLSAHTTIVRYKTAPGERTKVVDACRALFLFAEENELDVFSLAILNDVTDEDAFIVFERYESRAAEQRHLESEMCSACLAEIKPLIVGHDSRSYEILDV